MSAPIRIDGGPALLGARGAGVGFIVRGEPTPQIITAEQRRRAKAVRKAARDARKRSRR